MVARGSSATVLVLSRCLSTKEASRLPTEPLSTLVWLVRQIIDDVDSSHANSSLASVDRRGDSKSRGGG